MGVSELLGYNFATNRHENESRFENFFSKLYNLALLSFSKKEFARQTPSLIVYPYLLVGRLFRDNDFFASFSTFLYLYPYLLVGRLFRDTNSVVISLSLLSLFPYLLVGRRNTLAYQPTVPMLQTTSSCRLLNASHLLVGRLCRVFSLKTPLISN